MNLCATLWKSYDALKQAHADAETLLKDGKNLSLSAYKNALEKLSKAKEEYDKSFYTELPDGRKIYTLDYISLIQICNDNGGLSISQILEMQGQKFLNDNFRINSLNLSSQEFRPLNLTTLDVSAFSSLTYLNCSNNQLTSLDVTKNTALTVLNCSSNQLTSLDVTKNIALTELNCSSNQLSSLDLKNNSALTQLYCAINKLISLDVTNNSTLTYCTCYKNQLTSLLSLINITTLEIVDASYNPLDSASQKLAEEKGWEI